MSDAFDPYYIWLGIPPTQQPPNHYRLLGVAQLESDGEVIRHAADQRMAFLRSFQNSEQSELSQQLLNEIATAKLCLLDSHQKAAYDAELAQKMTPGAVPPNLAADEPQSAFDAFLAASKHWLQSTVFPPKLDNLAFIAGFSLVPHQNLLHSVRGIFSLTQCAVPRPEWKTTERSVPREAGGWGPSLEPWVSIHGPIC